MDIGQASGASIPIGGRGARPGPLSGRMADRVPGRWVRRAAALFAVPVLAVAAGAVTITAVSIARTSAPAHASMSAGGLVSVPRPQWPGDAANWPIDGHPCNGDSASWCDMKMYVEATGLGHIIDKVTIKFRITPHWASAEVYWTITYQTPAHRFLSSFAVWAHVLCNGVTDCLQSDHPINVKYTNGMFRQPYPGSMQDSEVAIGLRFEATCVRCLPGQKHPNVPARTNVAYCSSSGNYCIFE
jgi:hypothetical protein